MAGLVRDTKTILLHGGMQDAVDDFLIEAPNMERIENGLFNKRGTISKRPGFEELPDPEITEAGPLFAIGEFLYVATSDGIKRYNGTAWQTVTSLPTKLTTVEKVGTVGERYGTGCVDLYVNDRFTAVAWDEAQGDSNDIYDRAVHVAFYSPDGLFLAKHVEENARHPRLTMSRYDIDVRLFYVKGTADADANLATRTITAAVLPLIVSSESVVAEVPNYSDFAETQPGNITYRYNVDANASFYAVAYVKSNLADVRLVTKTHANIPVSSRTESFIYGQPSTVKIDDSGSYIYVLFTDTDGTMGTDPLVTLNKYPANLGAALWSTDFNNTTSSQFISGSIVAPSGTLVYMAYSYSGFASVSEINVQTNIHSVLASNGSEVSTVGIPYHTLSSGLVYVDEELYVGAQLYHYRFDGYPDQETFPDLQREVSYTSIIARVDFGEDRVIPVSIYTPHRSRVWDSHTDWAALPTSYVQGTTIYHAVRIPTANGQLSLNDSSEIVTRSMTTAQIDVVSTDLSPDNVEVHVVGDGVIIGSGVPLWFDGQFLREMFPLDTPGLRIALLDNTASDARAKVLVGYSDSFGNVHRSSVGLGRVVCLNDGGPTVPSTITGLVAAPLSVLSQDIRTAFAELYFLKDASDLYRLAGRSEYIPNNQGGVSVVAKIAKDDDTTLVPLDMGSSRLLYTEGNVVTAEALGPPKLVASGPDRVFWVSADNTSLVYFSKRRERGYSPEFNNLFHISLGAGVSATGLASLDDKFVVFTKSDVYVLYGQGPTNTGQGESFGVLRLPSGVGCVESSSIVETPEGVMFRSARGYYLVGRDLSVTYVGGGVEDLLVGASVKAGIAIPSRTEVRIYLDYTGTPLDSDGPEPDSTRPPTPKYGNGPAINGTALSYNYEQKAWSIQGNQRVERPVIYQGKLTVIRSSTLQVWQESSTVFTDPGGNNLLTLITPWIKLRNIQDYGQLWKATLLGRYLSTFTEDEDGALDSGDINVSIAYDYASEDVDTKLFRASNELQPTERDSTVVSPGALRLQVRPTKQKCSAVRFTIEEHTTGDADGLTYRPGQGFEITSIDLELGMRPGTNTALPAKSKK